MNYENYDKTISEQDTYDSTAARSLRHKINGVAMHHWLNSTSHRIKRTMNRQIKRFSSILFNIVSAETTEKEEEREEEEEAHNSKMLYFFKM